MTSLQGHFLIADPGLIAPMFTRSVVLLLDHDEAGAMGMILNAPTGTTMSDLAGRLFEEGFAWDKLLHLGGPVRRAGAPPLNIEGESFARWKAGDGVDTLAPGRTFRHRHPERG